MRAQRATTPERGLPAEALVIRVEEGRVDVRLIGADIKDSPEETARIAVPGYRATVGDRVLVQWTASGSRFVTAVVHAAKAPSLTTPEGASASLEGSAIVVRSAEGEILARYDASAGVLSLRGERDVHVAAPEGNLRLTAKADVEIKAGGSIVQEAGGRSRLRLGAEQIELVAEDAAFALGRFELRAERLIERVGDALVSVERLYETRAEQMRSIVRGTLEMVGRRTTIRSEKDTRIDGERVLLG